MRKAFTFVEILVVMSLLGLLTGGVLVSYQRTSARQTIEMASQKLRQVYTSARANALSGKKDTAACGTVPLDGWVVNLNAASAPVTYSVYGVCGATTFPNPAAVESLPAGVTVVTNDTQMMFRPLNRGTDSTVITTVTLTNVGGVSTFAISAAGELVEPTPTPMACRGQGFTCYTGSQCCSGSCSSGSCL